jgi:hypothetical protein
MFQREGLVMNRTSECKGCGKAYDASESKCPNCGMKAKKPFYKSWVFWLIVGIVVIVGVLKMVFLSDLTKLLFR